MNYHHFALKSHLRYVMPAFFLFVFSPLNHAYLDIPLSDPINAPAPVSQKTLESKIRDAETNTELDEASKKRLLEYYRRATQNLDEAHANKFAAEAFNRARKKDPEQANRIRKKLEVRKAKTTADTLDDISVKTPFPALEQHLFSERANLAAVKAKLSDLDQQLALSTAKPNQLQQRLIDTNRSQEEITARLLQLETEGEQPLMAQAMRWMFETRLLALRSEIRMLDQELLSLPSRIELLELGLAWHELTIEKQSKRVALLQELVNRQRQIETEKVKEKAEKAKRELEGKHPLIQELGKDNALFTDELSRLTNELDRITRETDQAALENERIQDQFKDIRKKLEIGGFGSALGQVLIELYRQLPDPESFKKRAVFREKRSAEIGLQQLQYGENYRELSNLNEYIDELTAEINKQEADQIWDDLKRLAVSRKELLIQLKKLSGPYLQSLNDFGFIDRELLNTTQDYQNFLARNLFWTRSSPLPSLAEFKKMPERLDWLISPTLWGEVFSALGDQAVSSPAPVLGLILVVFLFWKSKILRCSLRETGANIGKISRDNISYTFYALILTLLLAASWPLLLALLGWQLSASALATPFTTAFSDSLSAISVPFFFLRFFWVTCEPGGLATVHFHMSSSKAQLLHRELGRVMPIVLPSQFIFMLMYRYDLAVSTGEAGRILIAIGLIALTFFLYRIIPNIQKPFSNDLIQSFANRLISKNSLLRILLIVLFLGLAVLDFIGYIFTVGLLILKLVYTLCFVVALFIVKKIAVRWLGLIQRRLAWQAALEKRAEEKAKREADSVSRPDFESETGEVEEPEIDYAGLSQESLYLLNIALALFGIFGLLGIWAEILPAFSLLNDITLWNHMGVISGEEQLVPVTLLDLALAIMIGFITIVATKYLPSLLEIIMLQRTSLTTGSRYTITTVTNYTIVAIGLILFFNLIGVDWSKVQWLVAALGVGIGFGLQEIVANFISGIIILFERPIRVGDVVSIGNQDGTVVRIRIRATTIRNWDRKELLVPNKQFITGQLINWSLSETTTRIVIPVGLAYGSDVGLAMKTLMGTAEENPDVLSDPGPSVVFDAFGDNALSFKLRCFVSEIDYRSSTITALHKEINRKFNEAGLVFAFPQQDMHLDSSAPLDVRLVHEVSGKNGSTTPAV